MDEVPFAPVRLSIHRASPFFNWRKMNFCPRRCICNEAGDTHATLHSTLRTPHSTPFSTFHTSRTPHPTPSNEEAGTLWPCPKEPERWISGVPSGRQKPRAKQFLWISSLVSQDNLISGKFPSLATNPPDFGVQSTVPTRELQPTVGQNWSNPLYYCGWTKACTTSETLESPCKYQQAIAFHRFQVVRTNFG